jgi:hypothetical protein
VAVSAAGRDLRPTIAVFFTTEERFPFVKALQIRNRIIPVVDDLARARRRIRWRSPFDGIRRRR